MDRDGLIFFPSRYDPPIGHAGFELALGGAPRSLYFDVQRASFPVEQSGALRRMTMVHPYRSANEFHFTSGRIRLDAFDGDYLEIVSFGGQGSIAIEENQTLCRITSSAPFLPLDTDFQSPFVLLESEIEIVMAMCRARWGREEYRHIDHMGELDPMTLFVSSIKSLEERLERLSRVEADPASRRALRLVRDIHRQLERSGEWPSAAVGLDDLL